MSLVLNEVVIESRSDGFINGTQLCKAGGKKFKDWYRLDSVKKLIETLENDLNSNDQLRLLKLVDVKVGGNHSGSWIHPDLAVQLAQWVSPMFAIKVSRWVRELMLTGSVQIDTQKTNEDLLKMQLMEKVQQIEQQQREIEEKNQLVEDQQKKIEEAKKKEQRLYNINAELLLHKKLSERNEFIYIASTKYLSQQGLFKVGRTKNIKNRSSGHNTTHPAGDKVKILCEFKVNDATLVEGVIHKKLSGLRPDKNNEFFMCPFDLLKDLCGLIIDQDKVTNKTVDAIIDTVYKLKQNDFSYIDWTYGIDESIFDDQMELSERVIENDEIVVVKHATFEVAGASDEQKQAFVRDCIIAYQKNILLPQQATTLVWTAFQSYLLEHLNVEKKNYKALEWRSIAKRTAAEEKLGFVLSKKT